MTPASASDARRCQSSRVASRRARGACGLVSARTRAKLGQRVARHGATPTRASRRETSSRDARGRANDGMLTTRLFRVFREKRTCCAGTAESKGELPRRARGSAVDDGEHPGGVLRGAIRGAGGVGRSRQVRRGVCARNARASTRNNRNHHVSRSQHSRQRKFADLSEMRTAQQPGRENLVRRGTRRARDSRARVRAVDARVAPRDAPLGASRVVRSRGVRFRDVRLARDRVRGSRVRGGRGPENVGRRRQLPRAGRGRRVGRRRASLGSRADHSGAGRRAARHPRAPLRAGRARAPGGRPRGGAHARRRGGVRPTRGEDASRGRALRRNRGGGGLRGARRRRNFLRRRREPHARGEDGGASRDHLLRVTARIARRVGGGEGRVCEPRTDVHGETKARRFFFFTRSKKRRRRARRRRRRG